jgi:hypothetical protein
VRVLFRVGPVAVAVFEVEPKIFHGFAPKFLDDPVINLLWEFAVLGNAQRVRQRGRIGGVFLE